MAERPLKMAAVGCENDPADSQHAAGLLAHLPPVEKVRGLGMRAARCYGDRCQG